MQRPKYTRTVLFRKSDDWGGYIRNHEQYSWSEAITILQLFFIIQEKNKQSGINLRAKEAFFSYYA